MLCSASFFDAMSGVKKLNVSQLPLAQLRQMSLHFCFKPLHRRCFDSFQMKILQINNIFLSAVPNEGSLAELFDARDGIKNDCSHGIMGYPSTD